MPRPSTYVVRAAVSAKAPTLPLRDALAQLPALPGHQDRFLHRAIVKILDQFEMTVGGRTRLLNALLAAPAAYRTEELATLIRWMADPANDLRKLSVLCDAGEVSLLDVLEAFKHGTGILAFVEAIAAVHEKTPKIAQDVLARALPLEVPCPKCEGAKTIPGRKGRPATECAKCQGTGTITKPPTLNRQKYALSLGPLAPKGTPLVAIDQRELHVHDASPQGFAKLLAATDRLLHARPTPPEAETAPPEVV